MRTVTAAKAPHSHEILTAWVRHLTDQDRSEATISTYLTLLCWLDRQLPHGLVYACTEELRDAIYDVPGRSQGTIALYRAAVATFFAWATDPDDPWLDYDPSRRLPRPKLRPRRPRPISNDALRDILSRARDPYRLWYLLAAGQGLRCCEIAQLSRDDISQDVTYVLGKGDKERIVPTHPAVWEIVRTLPAGPIARSYSNTSRQAGRRDVQRRGNCHLARLGHSDVTMHRLRHWYGTHVYRTSGRDLRAAQELLGHASPHTTQLYVATVDAEQTAAVRALPLPI